MMLETMQPSTSQVTDPRPGAARRLLAMVYEMLPVFAIAFIATMAVVRFMPEDHVPIATTWYRAYLLAVIGAYYVVGWKLGGQTLGMRPWKLAVVAADRGSLTWSRAIVRYLVALVGWLPLGAGHWWALIDREGRSWHDRAAATLVVGIDPATR